MPGDFHRGLRIRQRIDNKTVSTKKIFEGSAAPTSVYGADLFQIRRSGATHFPHPWGHPIGVGDHIILPWGGADLTDYMYPGGSIFRRNWKYVQGLSFQNSRSLGYDRSEIIGIFQEFHHPWSRVRCGYRLSSCENPGRSNTRFYQCINVGIAVALRYGNLRKFDFKNGGSWFLDV